MNELNGIVEQTFYTYSWMGGPNTVFNLFYFSFNIIILPWVMYQTLKNFTVDNTTIVTTECSGNWQTEGRGSYGLISVKNLCRELAPQEWYGKDVCFSFMRRVRNLG